LTPSASERLKVLITKGQARNDAEAAEAQRLLIRYDASRQCRASALYSLQFALFQHWEEEFHKSQIVAKDFDASGLTAAEMVKRGKQAYEAEQWNLATRWFRKAADLGDAEAMLGMSWIYSNGRGIPKDDAQALHWVRMAAERGSTGAMVLLADDYENGNNGIAKDYVKAMRWYQEAVNKGSANAMMDVGELYDQGRGVPVDYTEAMKWYHKAAEAGSGFALWQIGMHYTLGQGVPEDDEQARYWMKKAVTSGDDIARTAANEWLVNHPEP
jgi:TPR repeat protein